MFDSYIEPTLSNLTMNHENTTYPKEDESCIEILLKVQFCLIFLIKKFECESNLTCRLQLQNESTYLHVGTNYYFIIII